MRSLWAFRTESGTVVPAAEAAIFQMEDLPMIRTKAIAITLLSCCAAAAGTVDLYFNQLPSTLGWNYNTPVAAGTTGAPLAESSAVSLLRQGLKMDSMGPDDVFAYYSLLGVVGAPTEVDWTMRVTNSDGYGWAVGVNTGTDVYAMAFEQASIESYGFSTIDFDTASAFHNYRMVVNPGSGMALYVDGSSTPLITGGNV